MTLANRQTADAVETLEQVVAALPSGYKKLDMMDVLIPAVQALPEMLNEPNAWQSKYIDYEEPYLMRLYRQFDQPSDVKEGRTNSVRVNLHYFFAKTDEDFCPYSGLLNPYAENKNGATGKAELYHYHNWAAGFFLFEGSYAQKIGHAKDFGLEAKPPATGYREHHAKNRNSRAFAFNDPFIWHQVIPQNNKPVCTMMVSYATEDWKQPAPRSPKLRELCREEKNFMLGKFKDLSMHIHPSLKPA